MTDHIATNGTANSQHGMPSSQGGQGTQTRSGANHAGQVRDDDPQKHASERSQQGNHVSRSAQGVSPDTQTVERGSANAGQQGRTDRGGDPVDRGHGKAGAQTVGSAGAGHAEDSESYKKHAPATDAKSHPTEGNGGARKHGHVQTTGRGGEEGDASEVKVRDRENDNHAAHRERSKIAETAIPEDAKARIAKSEGKDGKRYKKALKEEAKAEDTTLKNKMKELESLRKVHKQAAKDEAAAAASHSKAVKNEHKLDMDFLSARTKHESALADLKAKEVAVTATKRHTEEQNQLLQVKQKEVEDFRGKKAADDVGVSFLYIATTPAQVSAS